MTVHEGELQNQSDKGTLINSIEFFRKKPMKSKANKLVATVIVWKLESDKLRQHRRYILDDPYIVSKIHHGSKIDKIIHKTSDGVAYVYYKDYKN